MEIYDKVNGVPIFIRPVDFYGKVRSLSPSEMRRIRDKYRCFVSENVRWKSRVKSVVHEDVDDSVNFSKKLVRIVIMGRAKNEKDKEEIEKILYNSGIRVNPYGMSSPVCFGFYLSDFNKLKKVVELLGDRVEAVGIVNTVWYLKYNIMLNLRKLIENAGFTPREEKAFKAVMGIVNYSTVRVFYNGTVGVYAPHTPESVDLLGRQLYSLFRKVGSLM